MYFDQREFIEQVEDPGFWHLRQATLMQYFVSLSKTKANLILFTFVVDPIIYNGVMYYLIDYLWIVPSSEGGCCMIPSSRPVLIFYFDAYSLLHVIYTAFITFQFFQCLSPDPETGSRSKCKLFLIFIAVLTNMHLLLFGWFPCLHRSFKF